MATAASFKGDEKLAAARGEEDCAAPLDTEPSRHAFHFSGH
jgi:hypothetical protein